MGSLYTGFLSPVEKRSKQGIHLLKNVTMRCFCFSASVRMAVLDVQDCLVRFPQCQRAMCCWYILVCLWLSCACMLERTKTVACKKKIKQRERSYPKCCIRDIQAALQYSQWMPRNQYIQCPFRYENVISHEYQSIIFVFDIKYCFICVRYIRVQLYLCLYRISFLSSFISSSSFIFFRFREAKEVRQKTRSGSLLSHWKIRLPVNKPR